LVEVSFYGIGGAVRDPVRIGGAVEGAVQRVAFYQFKEDAYRGEDEKIEDGHYDKTDNPADGERY